MRVSISACAVIGASLFVVACSGGSSSSVPTKGANAASNPSAVVPRSVVPISTAAPHTFQTYTVPTASSRPVGITVGPDRLYFTELAANKLGSITYSGVFGAEVTLPDAAASPGDVAEGIDGSIWFTEATGSQVGALSPATQRTGTITTWNDFGVTSASTAMIISDPLGVLWVGEFSNASVLRMTTWGSLLSRTTLTGSQPSGMAVGSDNATVWVAEEGGNKIAKLNSSGTLLAEYAVPSGSSPYFIATGPDGNEYFTENVSADGVLRQGYIGKVTPSGTMTMTPLPHLGSAAGIAAGPDGNMWFVEYNTPQPAMAQFNIATSAITEYAIPGPANTVRPQRLVFAPDGQFWFTTDNYNTVDSFHP